MSKVVNELLYRLAIIHDVFKALPLLERNLLYQLVEGAEGQYEVIGQVRNDVTVGICSTVLRLRIRGAPYRHVGMGTGGGRGWWYVLIGVLAILKDVQYQINYLVRILAVAPKHLTQTL